MNYVISFWTKLFGCQEKFQNGNLNKQEQQKQSNQNINNQQKQTEKNNWNDVPQEIASQLFQLSSKFIKQTKQIMNDNKKLKLYSYYKQATQGNCQIEKPAIYDIINRKKWNQWNSLKGISKLQAMKKYTLLACVIDHTIYKKIQDYIIKQNGEDKQKDKIQQKIKNTKNNNGGKGIQKVEVVDYSDEYSHPYFKRIIKGEDIDEIDPKLLLQKNDSPGVFPLHFAIDKQRQDLVQKFLKYLSKQQIEKMKDQQQTSVYEYAQLMENEQILTLLRQKLEY